jgi:hypothetical protein
MPKFIEDFVPGAALAIDHSRAVTVYLSHLVFWKDELPAQAVSVADGGPPPLGECEKRIPAVRSNIRMY